MNSYIDAHIHIADCSHWEPSFSVFVCAPSHSLEEFLFIEKMMEERPQTIVAAFGIHPQNPQKELFPLLENLAKEGRIQAVGEAGFDFFTPEYRAGAFQQEEVWQLQLELACQYGLPLVIHCRKAMDRFFAYSKELKKLPAVVFHAFPGSYQDAVNLLKRGINSYFSFGKELIRGRKNSIHCVASLPLERLLAETDAPYQSLRNQAETPAEDIQLVYQEFAKIKNIQEEGLKTALLDNFCRAFDRFRFR